MFSYALVKVNLIAFHGGFWFFRIRIWIWMLELDLHPQIKDFIPFFPNV